MLATEGENRPSKGNWGSISAKRFSIFSLASLASLPPSCHVDARMHGQGGISHYDGPILPSRSQSDASTHLGLGGHGWGEEGGLERAEPLVQEVGDGGAV